MEGSDKLFGVHEFRRAVVDHFRNRHPGWQKWLIERGIVVGYLQSISRRISRRDTGSPEGFDSDGHALFVNTDLLRRVAFFQVKDAFTTFQDIQSFLGGVLPANTKGMVALSDLNRIQKAGFDTKASFRKAPEKMGRRWRFKHDTF